MENTLDSSGHTSLRLRVKRLAAGRIRRALVVLAHPCSDSLNRAIADAAASALRENGVNVDVADLYEMGFAAAMTPAERVAYHGDEPILDDQVRELAGLIRECDAVVFVYPTWWSGLPAVLKGFLDRVLVPGVAFGFNDAGKVVPGLGNVRHIVGISTYGSPHHYVAAVNDNGRRMLTRALRMSCGVRTSTTWLGLYALDTSTDDERREFLARVRTTMRGLT